MMVAILLAYLNRIGHREHFRDVFHLGPHSGPRARGPQPQAVSEAQSPAKSPA